jgi:hypothetical protein
MPVAIARHGERIDRHERNTGRPQRRRQQTFRGLDRYRDRLFAERLLLSEQAHQDAEPGRGVLDPQLHLLSTIAIDDTDIVMVFRPINTAPHLHR